MALSIDDPQIEQLAQDLAAVTAEPVMTAIAIALRERLERVRGHALGMRAAGIALGSTDDPSQSSAC